MSVMVDFIKAQTLIEVFCVQQTIDSAQSAITAMIRHKPKYNKMIMTTIEIKTQKPGEHVCV